MSTGHISDLSKASPCKVINNSAEMNHQVFEPTPLITGGIDATLDALKENILKAANEVIPLSSGKLPRTQVPWWNDSVEKAFREKRKQLRIFQRNPTQEHLIAFKRQRAHFRRMILEAKKKSWQQYVFSMTTATNVSEVWRKMKKVNGKYSPFRTPIIQKTLKILKTSLIYLVPISQ
ncbi:hypothetical protein JTB14_026425 [Gonioctena quinquepunctata]|nr:hypothetical protein JTB14_026425 [Gonioctena quinquepunctata]